MPIVGKVWPYILAGIAIGAGIHGYVPEDFMASFMGKEAWWSVTTRGSYRHHVCQCRGHRPIVQALLAKGAALGTVLAFMMSVIDSVSLPTGDGDLAQGAESSPDSHLHWRCRRRHSHRWLRLQLCFVIHLPRFYERHQRFWAPVVQNVNRQ